MTGEAKPSKVESEMSELFVLVIPVEDSKKENNLRANIDDSIICAKHEQIFFWEKTCNACRVLLIIFLIVFLEFF